MSANSNLCHQQDTLLQTGRAFHYDSNLNIFASFSPEDSHDLDADPLFSLDATEGSSSYRSIDTPYAACDVGSPDTRVTAVGKCGRPPTELVQRLQKIKEDTMQAAILEGSKAGLADQANILMIAGFTMPLKGSRENPWNAYVALNIGNIPDGGTLFSLAHLL